MILTCLTVTLLMAFETAPRQLTVTSRHDGTEMVLRSLAKAIVHALANESSTRRRENGV